jgi:hypothetical protein
MSSAAVLARLFGLWPGAQLGYDLFWTSRPKTIWTALAQG